MSTKRNDCTSCAIPYIEPTTGEEHDVVYCTDYMSNCLCECHNKYVDMKIKEHCDIFDEEEIKAIKRGNIVSFAFENYWIFFCPMCGKKLEVND